MAFLGTRFAPLQCLWRNLDSLETTSQGPLLGGLRPGAGNTCCRELRAGSLEPTKEDRREACRPQHLTHCSSAGELR